MAEPRTASRFACITDTGPLMMTASGEGRWGTVIGIEGGFSRRIGSQLAVSDGRAVGDLADHCLEAAIIGELRKDEPRRVVRFGRGSPFVDIRLMCGGGIDVLIDPRPDHAVLRDAAALAAARRPFNLRLPLHVDAPYALDHPAEHAARDYFPIGYLPPLQLVVAGHGSELEALVAIARAAGITTSTIVPHGARDGDARAVLGQPPDFATDARTAIVILFHDHEWERSMLPWALRSPARYVGVLGSPTAHGRRMPWLEGQGLAALAGRKLRAPVGLVQGTRTPAALALSILAEIVAFDEAELQGGARSDLH